MFGNMDNNKEHRIACGGIINKRGQRVAFGSKSKPHIRVMADARIYADSGLTPFMRTVSRRSLRDAMAVTGPSTARGAGR